MAVCSEVHSKFGAWYIAPRFTPRDMLKIISTAVGSVRGASLFKHTTTTTPDFCDPCTGKTRSKQEHLLSRCQV
jgi:hypothetical protein